ncbi:MAG: 23S rRNA (pseudouridine(1915)-N(3))-methyltransferase RlmH [Pyrinomonadaceae bacterium]
MKFRFTWIGKTKDKNYRALQEEYLRRLSHFVKCEVVEIRDSAPHEGKEAEGKRIIEKLNQSPLVCLLDVNGRGISSPELAKEIEKWQNAGIKEINFVIGGADGIADEVAEKAHLVLSLSFLTFTHEMARVVILEQLYRAYTIIKGFPYQK